MNVDLLWYDINPYAFGEKNSIFFSLLMTALSLQLHPNDETPFFTCTGCSATHNIEKFKSILGVISVESVDPHIFGANSH